MAKTPTIAPKIAGKFSLVSPSDIRPDPKNPNRQSKFVFGKLVESIKKFGFTDPIIVREDDNETLVIVGGEHRWRVATELGMPEVPIINLGPVSEADAHLQMVVLNETKGTPDDDLLSALLKEVHVEVGDAGLVVLPYTEARLQELLDVPPPEDEDAPDVVETKLKASDLCALLEMKGMTQAELERFLEIVRRWSGARRDLTKPAWIELRRLLTPPE